VTSAVVRFEPRAARAEGFEALSMVVRALFNYRRKTLSRAARSVSEQEPALAKSHFLRLPPKTRFATLDPKP